MRFITLFVLAAGFIITGCNTVKGIGQDIGKAGNAIERAAK
jgi:predicted small secreted protein